MTAAPVLRCEELTRSFGRGGARVTACRSVTCAVHAGERIVITGPSGSGKSTLLHLCAGFDTPTSGEITWPALGPGRPRRGSVGMVFQAPSLIPELDTIENVMLPLLLAAWPEDEARPTALAALAELGLEALAAHVPDDLSGGQQQCVAVARVLAVKPRLILADEPTGQLDGATAAVVLDHLSEAAARTEAALAVTTHDTRITARFDTCWSMHDGELRTPREALWPR